MNLFEDLQDRGLIKQTTNADKLRQLLNEDKITFYIGFDPTADSLHVGHLLQLITAKRLLEAGHQIIIVLGGATAMIGDPSGKSEMRKMLSRSDIRVNSEAIIDQIDTLLVHHEQIDIMNNLLWLDGKDFLVMLQEVGPHFSVNNMLRAECFKSRMEHGLSFLEFNYMIMQAFDFFHLHQEHDCLLQIGGDDQWSNILAGIDLIHKKTGQEAFGLTLPLLVNSDGTKMGKTERGAIWLDPDKTSPFEFFQFWRNIPDDKVEECLLFFTRMKVAELGESPSTINELKKLLALEITGLVHGEEIARQALEQAEALFEKRDTSLIEVVPVPNDIHILDLLMQCEFAKSRTDGRNLINNGGITINDETQTNPTITISKSQFGEELVVRKGKKHFCRLRFEDK
jgi:tyrosyl-tRNA synthetase